MTVSNTAGAWACLGALYVVWGTGCPAIKMCLDQGFGPFGLGALRLLAASAILVGVALVARRRVDPDELPRILGVGVLFWVVGSGLQVYGQQGVSAGVAALVLGTTPLWGALRERATMGTLAGLGLALGGLGMAAEGVVDPASLVALCLAAVVGAWAGAGAGTLRSDVLWVAAIQLGVGGVGQLIAMGLSRESMPDPSFLAWGAWGWLVLGPAVLGMLAYVHATRSLPVTVVLTYAVVNPAVALLMGWAFLEEPLGPRQLIGLLLVGLGLMPVLAPHLLRSRTPFGGRLAV